jgi:biopolymer transport protein ExbB/TolQ
VRDAFLAAASPATAGRLWLLLADATLPVIWGLVVACVLTVGRAYLVSQAETITEHIREFSVRLINALNGRPDVRLGHR